MSRFPRLKSSLQTFISKFRSARGGFLFPCLGSLCLVFAALATPASAQDFTLTMAPFTPFAVNPQGTAVSNVSLVAGTGFSGTVNLACQVTTTLSSVTMPQCQISPQTVQPSGSASATILSQYVVNGNTVTASPGTYTVIVTGTGPSTTHQGAQAITVLAVNPQFTITVTSPVLPKTVTPGNGGIGTVSINPIFGYNGFVTLSCASITPLVTIPPQCQFSYPSPQSCPGAINGQGVCVNGASGPVSIQVSIVTFGPISTTSLIHPRIFYALWLPLPMLAIAGMGAAVGGRRCRKAWSLLALFMLGGTLLLLPACGNNLIPSKITPQGITPNGAYTFTLMGVDQNGNISSNTGTANEAPTIALTVN
jgi:hypothetical protein